MWPFRVKRKDRRSGRVAFLIECLLNQNARDMGAAESPAMTRPVIDLLAEKDVGMVQIPCPEIACLGFPRRRMPGQSIRDALSAPQPTACCERLAVATADRIQHYLDQGFEIAAVLGGNMQSPGCAVHQDRTGSGALADSSGVFMRALSVELARRGLQIPFRGMRDADRKLLNEDLDWLRARL